MKTFATTILLCLLTAATAFAQEEQWEYDREITFPAADTAHVKPYLAAVADDGTLYVVSSRATDTSAHNALWKAAPGAAQFELVQDYTAENDAFVSVARGVATLGNDVLVSVQNTEGQVGAIYYYENGDPAQRRAFSSANGSAGYGTYVYGMDATDSGYLYATLSYQTSIRLFDFTDPEADGFGNWVPIPQEQDWANTEVGGHDPGGVSAMRDIAVVPGADYVDEQPPFYTSRNASGDFSGGIAVWRNSSAVEPGDYTSERVSDPSGDLALSSFIATGIDADATGRLWVTGPDSTRLWVKAYEVQGTFAFEVIELPSSTSMSSPVVEGAPFASPNDVALDDEGARAYVTDLFARRVFAFEDASRVDAEAPAALPGEVRLQPGHPNPFTAATTISYELVEPAAVRLAVYDVLGREVDVLAEGRRRAGTHHVTLDGSSLPAGLYLARLEAHGRTQVQRLLLVK